MTKTNTVSKPRALKSKSPSKAYELPVLKADEEGIQRCSLCRRPFFPNVERVAFSFKAHIEQNHAAA
jgi:hypothetical protein